MPQGRAVPFSVLDLAPIVVGGDAAQALHRSRDLAQHAERLGYERYWLAEHHNMPGVASAATSLAIAHVAAGTSTMRVGAGGIMLPNHAPLVIAEQFGTLASLYPRRIDLGIGRAPGTDPLTMRALRRDLQRSDSFSDDVSELIAYFRPERYDQAVRAIPGAGLEVPVWLLGSSTYSAQLAASMGLPFAFAAHFSPDPLLDALAIYNRQFRPSEFLKAPYSMVCTNVYAADSDAEARRLFTSLEQAFLALRLGRPGPLPPPLLDMAGSDSEPDSMNPLFRYSIVGSFDTVRRKIEEFLELTQASELMVTAMMYDHAARVRSLEIIAAVRDSLRRSAEP